MGRVPWGVMDGDRWIAERLEYLRGLLGGDISDEQRQTIEAEIEVLRKERGLHLGGFRMPLFPSRWIGRLGHRKDRPAD
jgi:hypothetical protein